MRKLLLSSAAVTAAAALAFGLSHVPSTAQDTVDQQLGSVHFETSCTPAASQSCGAHWAKMAGTNLVS